MQSHPVWVCGLKLLHPVYTEIWVMSHSMWVCGYYI